MLLILTIIIIFLSSYVGICDFKEARKNKTFPMKAFVALLVPVISMPLLYLQEVESRRVERNISPWILSEKEIKTIKKVLSEHHTFEVDIYYVSQEVLVYQEMTKLLTEAGWTVHEGNGSIRGLLLGGGPPPIEFGFDGRKSKEVPEPINVLIEAFSEAGIIGMNQEERDYNIRGDYEGKNISLSIVSKPYVP